MKTDNDLWVNQLYFGDCLEVLKELYYKNKNGFIDLVYIDPPFNSKRNYNVLFESVDLADTKAQKEAFADTWSNVSYKDTLQEIKDIDLDLFSFLESLDKIRISQSAVSYLTTMAIRIWYIHRILKNTGSFYLHCDPTMSHYLKVICDLIFGEKNFRNEINWRRSNPKSNTISNLPNCRDVILRYTKSDYFTFNKIFLSLDAEYVEKAYRYTDKKGRYRLLPLLNPNDDRPNLTYEFLGVTRVWRWTKDRMQKAYDEGLVVQLKEKAVPQYKKYLDESEGRLITNDWNDIEQISNDESLGYPTQKPEELLERIIKMSTNEGDLVADFFCGCGTAISVAQKFKRKWLGVDISHLAIGLIERKRLIEPYARSIERPKYEIHGFPKDIASAKKLSLVKGGRFEFQHWIIEAKLGGVRNVKDVADGGWDGYLTIGITQKEKDIVLIEVKSGNVSVKNLREFLQVVDKNKAAMGIYVCFAEQVTKPMRTEAKCAGYYRPELFKQTYDKIQILTVEDILDNKGINAPNTNLKLFKTAENVQTTDAKQNKLF